MPRCLLKAPSTRRALSAPSDRACGCGDVSRACASKWGNRWRRHGDLGLIDLSSVPRSSPNATPVQVVAQIEAWRRDQKWSAARITHELAGLGVTLNRRTVTRHLNRLGLGHRCFLHPSGEPNRTSGRITARWPGHMVHLDVKKVGRIRANIVSYRKAPSALSPTSAPGRSHEKLCMRDPLAATSQGRPRLPFRSEAH